MIQLEERPVAAAAMPAPTRNEVVLWLTAVAGLTVVIALVPWERWCSYGINGFPHLCFSARIWSGSASLFGLLTVLLAGSFVASSIGRRWITREGISTSTLVLAAGYVTALAVKVAVVLADGGPYHAAQGDGAQPQFVGVWLGLTLASVATVSLLAALAGGIVSLRSWLLAAVVIATLSTVGAAYTWSGLAWWGGPLAPPAYLGGGNGIGETTSAGGSGVFQGLIFISNPGHLPATIDGVVVVESYGGFVAGPAYLLSNTAHCTIGAVTTRSLGQCAVPAAGSVMAPGAGSHEGITLAIPYLITRPAVYRVQWFRIRYHVGPLHYEIFRTDEFVVCAPEPGTRKCPGAGF